MNSERSTVQPESVPQTTYALPANAGRSRFIIRMAILLLIVVNVSAVVWWMRHSAASVDDIPRVELDDARPALRELLQQARRRVVDFPGSATAWGTYGMCLMQHDRPAEALICMRHAAHLDPASPRWPFYAGALCEQTDYQQAADWYLRALQLDSTYMPLRIRLARTLGQLNRYEEAIQILEPLLTDTQDSAACWVEVVRLARASGDFDTAMHTLKRARTAGIAAQELRLEEGILAMQAGNVDAAMQAQNEAELLPAAVVSNDDPWMNELRRFDASGFVAAQQADTMVQQGQYRDAIASFSRMSREFPERSRPAFNHALMLLSLGQTEAGINELRKLSRSFDQDPMIHFYLGKALMTAADLSAAEQSLQTAVRLKPDFGQALTALGSVYEQLKQPDNALITYSSAVIQNPEDLSTRLNLARLLIQEQRQAEALLTLQQIEQLGPLPHPVVQELSRLRDLLQPEPLTAHPGDEE